MTETLKSDWALEMAKSVTVEMIKSTKKTNGAETGQNTPPAPSAQNSGRDASVEGGAGGDDVPAGDVEAPAAAAGV